MIEYPLLIIFLIGLVCLIIPGRFRLPVKLWSFAGSLFCLAYGVVNILSPATESLTTAFRFTPYAAFTGLGCCFFCAVVVCYSLKYADFIDALNRYYGYIFWSVCFALATVYSASFVALLVFWGLSGLMLYLLANLSPGAANAAKKSFVFIGGSDALMVFGAAVLCLLSGTTVIDRIRVPIGGSALSAAAFLCLAAAALTKAGAMPFHSWIPDFAETAPLSLTAFLPASLDKLLGIFLLVLVCQQLFVLNAAMMFLLLAVGAMTVIAAVYMAMIQHDMRRLLAYHAVSQVGYMVLGIASGTALGVAGGVFHMINNALYKSGLFLTAGAVDQRTGTTDLDRLGGLSRYMPVTFAVGLIASLSISGIPPLNGFVSKWMIYQALFSQSVNAALGGAGRAAFIVFLVVAMFGSALTLASFIKLVHSAFLGQPTEKSEEAAKRGEVSAAMWLPMAVLAALCVAFGVFPYSLPLDRLILPALSTFGLSLPSIPGWWQADAATLFILAGLLLGAAVYLLSGMAVRTDEPFTGGEKLPDEARFGGADFYKTIADIGFFRRMYALAGKKMFDIYHLFTGVLLGIGGAISAAHTGSLRMYLFWFLAGFVIIFALLAG